MEAAEPDAHHDRIPVGGEEQGDDSEDHEAESHQGYGSNRKGTSRQNSGSVQKQPQTGQQFELAGGCQRDGQDCPGKQGGSQIEKKAPAHRMPQIPTIPTSLFLGGQKPQSCGASSDKCC